MFSNCNIPRHFHAHGVCMNTSCVPIVIVDTILHICSRGLYKYIVFFSNNYMLLTGAVINEIESRWVTGTFIFFYLIQAEKATFNLILSETDLNHSVHSFCSNWIVNWNHNDTLCAFLYTFVLRCVKQLKSIH